MPIQLGDSGTPVYIPPSNAAPSPAPAPSGGLDPAIQAGVNSNGGYTPSATAPPVTPAAPPSQAISFGGSTPDYSALIQSDPSYVAAQNAATQAQQQGDAQRRAAVRSAYVQYGGQMPSGWTDSYGDIDQATRDAAAGNQFSTNANIQNNYKQSAEQLRRALAARGMLQSGDLNYGQDQLDRGEGQAQYDASNAYLSQYNQALNSYAGVLGQNAQNLGSAIQGAESNVEANPAFQPVAPTTATYDAGKTAQYGTAIYVAPDGTLYDSSGNVYTPPGQAPAGTGSNYDVGFGHGVVPAGGF